MRSRGILTVWLGAACILLLPLLARGEDKPPARDKDKPTCAVLPFKAMGDISAGMAEILAERVFFTVAKSGHFQMIERTQVERTLKENQISTIVSDTAGIEAGRLLGSKYVIIGSVGQLGKLTTVNSRIVNVETGEITAQAMNDHEGRIEDLLRVAEQSAQQLLAQARGGQAPATPPAAEPGLDTYTAVALDHPAATNAGPTVPAAMGTNGTAVMTPGQPLSLDLGQGVRLELAWIAPGTFPMGAGHRARGTPVTLTHGYWIGRYEVSNQQYQRFVTAASYDGVRDSNRSHLHHIRERQTCAADTYPVIWVNFLNATAFCNWLTRQAQSAGQIPADQQVRLPTDAEWEYACRAGTATWYYTGNRPEDLTRAGWWHANCGRGGDRPVGQKAPNAWGLYDTLGNAAEWVLDWYDPKYSPRGRATDPTGPAPTRHRTLRGGAWKFDCDECHAGSRMPMETAAAADYTGFRIVLAGH